MLFAVVGMLMLPTACVYHSPSLSAVPNEPESKVFEAQASVVMKALARVLNEKKFKVKAATADDRRLETEWLQDGSYRSRVLAEILPLDKYRSELTVYLTIEKRPFLRDAWEPLDKIDKTVYRDFMNDVLIECYRVMYDRR